MSRHLSTDASRTPSPLPAPRGRHLRSGWTTSLPITAGDQGDPTGGETPPPPGVGVEDGFLTASSASGRRTTPMDRAMVVEGTPLRQPNSFVLGTPSSSEDEADSPLLLSEREPSVEMASMGALTAKISHETVEAALAANAALHQQMVASERQRNRDFDTNMASLGGRHSRIEQMFADVSERIGLVGAESSALVVLSKDVRSVVRDSMDTVLRTMAINDQKYRDLCAESDRQHQEAWAAFELRASEMHETHIKRVGDTSKSISDMQVKLQSSFDRMKYFEKNVQAHLEDRLPVILTAVVDKALAPTLSTVLADCLPSTFASVLEGSMADFQSRFGSADSAASTQQVRDLLEAATDARVREHSAVMGAIEQIGTRVSALDDAIAASEVPTPIAPPHPPPPPVAVRPLGSVHLPVPTTWGHNFLPSAPAPPPPPFSSPASGLRVDTAHSGAPGGRIKTPRFLDPARRARTMKTNRFDLAGLADTGYHIGDDGVDLLNELIISNCGYQSFHVDHPEDVLLCFQEIVNLHRLVVQTWTNTRTHFSGPVVEYIIEKALPVFPRLLDLDVSGTVKFYDGLQKISMRYLLPLMPFDSISLAFGYEGLCPPGLGTTRYSAIASAWMDVLPRLLPLKESEVESAIFSVGVDSNNGFDLMWRILELAVPGFKSMNPVQVPAWNSQTDVLSFCRAHLLYFRLQAKHNMFFSARTQTNMFLRNIQPSEYADVVTTLQSQVNAYLSDDDDGYLPANLCINGIATAIYMNASARVRDVGLASPRVRRVAGDWDSNILPPVSDDELPLCGVQGYCPRVYRVEQGQDRFRRPYDRDGPAGRGGRGFDRDIAGRGRGDFARDGRRPSPRDRSIRPDLRRRTFLPGVQCAACKRLGHEASSCDMLAIALFLDKHKKTLTEDSRRAIESTWVARFKEKLGQPQRSPTQVMKAYCSDLDISLGHLDLAMDWDCWPEDEYGDFTQDLTITQD